MRRIAVMIFILLATGALNSAENLSLIWPADRPLQVSGTFAEFRGSRYHHGIDIGCDGKIGYHVFASAAGSVEEIIYQNYGIGYCVVLRHPGGYKTLYGHLSAFAQSILDNPKIAARANNIRDHVDFREKFADGEIPVKQGDLIAYTGNSGIGPEHLHFELMDEKENPINPLAAGLSVPDYTPPEIEKIILVPLDGRSHINGLSEPFEIRIQNKQGVRSLALESPVTIGGKIGVMIDAYDIIGGKSHVGLFSAGVSYNNALLTPFRFDRFMTQASRECSLIYDINHSTFSEYRYFLHNRASGSGIIDIAKGSDDARSIIVSARDIADNARSFTIPIERTAELEKPAWVKQINLRKGKRLLLSSHDKRCSVEIPEGASLYDEQIKISEHPFTGRAPRGMTPLTGVYDASPRDFCATSRVIIRIALDPKNMTHAGIYAVDRNNVIRAQWSRYDKKRHELVAECWRLDGFMVATDDAAPILRGPKTIMLNAPILIRATDVGSGIEPSTMNIKVDGQKVVFYHDPDEQSFIILPHNNIWSGGTHSITAGITDSAGNRSNLFILSYTVNESTKKERVSRTR
jgi:hypothetical protein